MVDLGSSVGPLSLELAKKVGPYGKVSAIDFSQSDLALLQKRVSKKKIENIEIIHDEFMSSRLHPAVKGADIVFSVGAMDHIQDMKKLLKDIAYGMNDQGKICIVEYTNFFWFLPNSGWMADLEGLKQICRDAGFSVRIVKWRGFLWNYTCIYGIKSKEDIVVI